MPFALRAPCLAELASPIPVFTMKKTLATLAVALVIITFLSGCLVPERFSAKLDVEPDGGYSFHYSGTAIHALAAAQIQQAGPLSEKDEKALRMEADKLSRNPDVRRATYKGAGRYELEIETRKKAGQSIQLLDTFSVRTDKEGVMTIAASELKDKDRRELEKLGISINGTLEVRLPKSAEVISHNATSTPTFGMFGAYGWKIGRVDQRPMMKVRFRS